MLCVCVVCECVRAWCSSLVPVSDIWPNYFHIMMIVMSDTIQLPRVHVALT